MAGVKRYDAVVFSFPLGDTVYVDPVLVGHDTQALLRREGIRRAGGDVQAFSLAPDKYMDEARKQAAKSPGLRARPIDNGELREEVRGLARRNGERGGRPTSHQRRGG